MQSKTQTKGFRFYVLIFAAGIVGLSLILGSTPSYGQTQKASIDLNSASEKELESIKGVGPATVKKIIAGRPYKSVDDLSKVGISAKTIEGMKPLVKVGAPAAVATPAKVVPTLSPAASTPTLQKAPTPAATKEKTTTKPAAPAKLAPGQTVNINTATKEQLEVLREIGPVKAQAIIDGRPYKSKEDIMKIKGIKEKTFGKIKDFITVN